MAAKFPARVHILMAREERTALAIRRGPSKTCATVEWDRRKNTFRVGQWVRARIYERRCDLSPDGRYLLYFAFNGRLQSKVGGSWTALSIAPYLKAVGLWANGSAWGGGGLFLSNQEYWLNNFHPNYQHEQQQGPPGHLRAAQSFPFDVDYGGECPGVYYHRLQRDGWKLDHFNETDNDSWIHFCKPLPKGWVLWKCAHATICHAPGKGCYYDTHRLVHAEKGIELDFPDWEWAELDGKRLVWVEKGVLSSALLGAKGPGFTRVLFDFNPLEFEAMAAPY